MSGHDLLAHIVRLEQRKLSSGTLAVFALPDEVIAVQAQRQLSWSPSQAARVWADLIELRELQRLGMVRLHCLAARPALLNFLHAAAEDIALDPLAAESCSAVALDELSHGLAGDLALLERLLKLRYEYEDIHCSMPEEVTL